MSYAAAIDQLSAMVPELHARPGQPRRKFSLEEIGVLLGALGNPHKCFPSVLIAGTNGKGSTASTLASILIASGLRTGLYTSPHLTRVNERIRVDRAEISDEAFADLFFRVQDAAQKLVQTERLPQLPSFFEILTAQALLHFAEAGVQIAVLEVGMGGRLDATNIVDPQLSVITDISLDHTEWLGSTIAAITREKAGILRSGGTLVTLPQSPETNQVLREMTEDMGARSVNAERFLPSGEFVGDKPYVIDVLGENVLIESPLRGRHQQRNLSLAIAASSELATLCGFPITPASIASGIRQTIWPARLEKIRVGTIDWILDVAHNPAGAQALAAGLESAFKTEKEQRPKTLLFSCLRDKPANEMARILFPLFDRLIFAPIHSSRANALEDLVAVAVAHGRMAVAAASVGEAVQLAEQQTEGGIVVVSGSVYLVGEVRPILMTTMGVQP